MAKRFTDTGKWEKAWFRKLRPLEKCVWLFLCDKCDHAGIWDLDLEAFKYFVGTDVDLDQILKVFDGHLELIGRDKILLKDFSEFQYGHLNPENRVHKSVLTRLEKLKKKGLKSTILGAKDTDTIKDTIKDKEAFQRIAALYTATFLNTTIGNAEPRFFEQIKSSQDLADLEKSIPNYKLALAATNSERNWRAAKTSFETYLGTKKSGYFWRDYISHRVLRAAGDICGVADDV